MEIINQPRIPLALESIASIGYPAFVTGVILAEAIVFCVVFGLAWWVA